jgi:hypothetical protein
MENRPRWFGPALDRSARRGLHERLYTPPEWPHAAGVRKPDGANPGRWLAWLTDERLKPNHPQFPGASGIKIRDDWAWISVSGRRLILRTPLQPDGRPGPIETAATHVLADDFAMTIPATPVEVRILASPRHFECQRCRFQLIRRPFANLILVADLNEKSAFLALGEWSSKQSTI